MNGVMGETSCQLDEVNDGSSVNIKISMENCVLLERDDVSTYFEKLEGSQPPQNMFNLKDCNDFSSSDISIEEHIAAIKKATEDPKLDKQGTTTPDNITLEMSASILGIPLHIPENSNNTPSPSNITSPSTSNNFLSELYPEYTSSILTPISDQTNNNFSDIYTDFNPESIVNYLPNEEVNYLNDSSDSLLIVIPSSNNENSNNVVENQAYELYANGNLAITDIEPTTIEKNSDNQTSVNKYIPKCVLCNNIFESIKDLRYHKRLHKIKPDLLTEQSCNVCKTIFNNHCSFTLHHNKIHKTLQLRDSEIIYNGKKAHKCQICYSIFTDVTTFFSHNSPYDYISNLVNYCKICDIKFNEATETFIEHCKIIHNNDMCFECKICSIKMQLKSSLRCHVQFNHNVKKIYCKQCKSCLSEYNYIKTHLLENNDKNYTHGCPFCNSPISVSKDLQIKHIKDHLHNYEATFQCGICLNYFYTYYNFLHHSLELHNGIVNIVPLNTVVKSVELKTVNCRVSNHDEVVRFNNLDDSEIIEPNTDIVQEMRVNDCNIITILDSSNNTEILSSKKKSLQYFCEYCLDYFPTYKLLSLHLETCNSKNKKLPKQYEQFINDNKLHGDISRKIKITKEKYNKIPNLSQYSKPKIVKSDKEIIPCTITSVEAAILEKPLNKNDIVISNGKNGIEKHSDASEIVNISVNNNSIKIPLIDSNVNVPVNIPVKIPVNHSIVNIPVIVPNSQCNVTDIVRNKPMAKTTPSIVPNSNKNATVIVANPLNNIRNVTNNESKVNLLGNVTNTAMSNCHDNIAVLAKPISNSTQMTNCVNNTTPMSNCQGNIAVLANTSPISNRAQMTNSINNATPNCLENIAGLDNSMSPNTNDSIPNNSLNSISVVRNSNNEITIMTSPVNSTSMVTSVTNIQAITSYIITNEIIPITNEKCNNKLIQNQIKNTSQINTYPINNKNLGLLIMPITSNNVIINNSNNLPIINQLNNDNIEYSKDKNHSINVTQQNTKKVSEKESPVKVNSCSDEIPNNVVINYDPSVPSTSSENNYPMIPEYNDDTQVAKDLTLISGELVCSDTNTGVEISIVDHEIIPTEKPKSKKITRKKRKIKNIEKIPIIKKSRFDNNQPIPSYEGNQNIPCLICQKTCINTFDLELHVKNKHNACKLCEIEFNTQDLLKEHENEHKNGNIYFYMCLCTKSFKNIESLNKHLEQFGRNKRTYKGYGLITEHDVMLKRKVTELYVKNMYILPTKAICSYCNGIFDCNLLDDHNEIIHNVCMCTNCDVRYVRTSIVKSKIDGDVLYLCNKCIKPDS